MVAPCYWHHVTQYNQPHGQVVGDYTGSLTGITSEEDVLDI